MIWPGDRLTQCRLDEFLMFGEDDQAAVVDWLAPIIDKERLRARKPDDVGPFNRTVGLVVANALSGGTHGVHYSRRPETYSGASPYKPAWLGSTHLLGVINGLAKEGLVEAAVGRWDGPFSLGLQSAFSATHALVEGLDARNIGLEAVRRDTVNAPVIVLKDENKRRICYDPRGEWIAQRIGELRAYNAFIEDQDIFLPGHGTPRFCSLTRIYNDGSWKRGGRHYQGWWQNIGPAERLGILINGQGVIELDFGGFMTRALYHLSGLDFQGDPYDVPEVRGLFEGAGLDWLKEGRPIVKDAINVLLNVSSRHAIYKMRDQFPDQRVPLKHIVPRIIEYHKPIGDSFFKVVSPRIMNIESNICSDIILTGMSDGVVILPIVDSFITDEKNNDYLRGLMYSSYRRELRFEPLIH